MEKLKKTHSSNINSPLIEQLKMILENIAYFNAKSGPESMVGLTSASRKYLSVDPDDDLDMDLEIEPQPLMERVSRKML